MTKVGVAQNRINEMNGAANKLVDCVERMRCEEDKSKISSLEENYGVTPELLYKTAQLLNITASNFQEDLDKCDVDCKCW